MSELPQINPERVVDKILGKLIETQKQLAQMETLAEALLEERDSARGERNSAFQELRTLRESLESTESEDSEE